MSQRGGAVHVVTTRRRYKGRVYATHLLRRSYREGEKVKNETVGNLSHLPEPLIEVIRRALRGETFVPVGERLQVVRSLPHGHVQAVRVGGDVEPRFFGGERRIGRERHQGRWRARS